MMDYVWAFLIGGLFCVAGQILMDTTKLTAPRILVIFVLAGVVLQAFNLYEPIVELAGNGAMTPLPGFGYNLAKGADGGCKGWIPACDNRSDKSNRRRSGCGDYVRLYCFTDF